MRVQVAIGGCALQRPHAMVYRLNGGVNRVEDVTPAERIALQVRVLEAWWWWGGKGGTNSATLPATMSRQLATCG